MVWGWHGFLMGPKGRPHYVPTLATCAIEAALDQTELRQYWFEDDGVGLG